METLMEVMLWHGNVQQPVERGHWYLLMIQPNAAKQIRQRFILQIDNEPKDTEGVSRGK